ASLIVPPRLATLPRRFGITGIQRIKHRNHRRQDGVIILLQRAGASHDGCQTWTLRYRDTSHIEVMNQCAQPHESDIALEIETRHQHLKSYFRSHMSEFSVVEIESDRTLRAVLYAFQPHKPGVGIDKPTYEPRRG